MEIKAHAKIVRISPQKVRLTADLVKGLKAGFAIVQLQVLSKRSTTVFIKLIKSAMANARHNFNISEPEQLIVKNVYVNDGPTMKRWSPRAMGRACTIRKRTSNITVVLSDNDEKKRGKIEITNDDKK